MHRSNNPPRPAIFGDTLYRSITEARTACFFAYAGIAYTYEPDLIELCDGQLYLPDFILPDFGVYVEVKPNNSIIRDTERYKADLLAESGEDVWLTYGSPKQGIPWFEHIGHSEMGMIANDNDHAKGFWALYADKKTWSPLGAGPHSRPRRPQDDTAIELAMSHAATYEPAEQTGFEADCPFQAVLENARRMMSQK